VTFNRPEGQSSTGARLYGVKSCRAAYRLNFEIKNLNDADFWAGGSFPPLLFVSPALLIMYISTVINGF
jgi:hypothetical protein